MPISCSVNLNVLIPAGPNVSVVWAVSADAYDRATVTISKGKTGTLELQPAALPGEVLLLVITSSDYTGNVKYNFGGAGWLLTQPQVISGVGLMGAVSLSNSIVFDNTNASAVDITVDVLVLRSALTQV